MTVGVSHEKVSQVVFLLVRWPSCACRHSSIRTHREAIVARCSVPGGESSLHPLFIDLWFHHPDGSWAGRLTQSSGPRCLCSARSYSTRSASDWGGLRRKPTDCGFPAVDDRRQVIKPTCWPKHSSASAQSEWRAGVKPLQAWALHP